MEKDQESMTTVAMKPEYASSEYPGSEPPPAYRRPMSASVQIARIAALTIVASAFILGAFILASAWVQTRAGCQQLEQLDAMLDKELALENRAYGNDGLVAEPLPMTAHALRAAPPAPQASRAAPEPPKKPVGAAQTDDELYRSETTLNEDKLQKLDDDKEGESSDESNSSSGEDEHDRTQGGLRLPIQFDLDDLAGAFLANNNHKGRMNCVVERRHEEVMEKRFPFNLLQAFASRAEPSERIAIICHGGDDKPEFPEPAAQVFAFPLTGPHRMPVRPQPAPLQATHRAAPVPMPMSWDSSEESSPPREMRIHVQRIIAIPRSLVGGPAEPNMIPFSRQDDAPFPPRPDVTFQRPEIVFPFSRPEMPMRSEMMRPQEMITFPRQSDPENQVLFQNQPQEQQSEQNEQATMMHQVPSQQQPQQPIQDIDNSEKAQVDNMGESIALPWGLTPETLRAIHRHAAEVERQEEADAEQRRIDSDMQEVKTIVNTIAAAAAAEMEGASARAQSQDTQDTQDNQEQAQDQQVHLDAPVLIQQENVPEETRPHYVQPRSVRSVDSLLHREKRVKRCACDCH